MNEVRELVNAFDAAMATGLRCAIATIVSVEGSSYRRPGARMIILESGASAGTISAGCLETDLVERAKLAIGRGQPELVVCDTTSTNEELAWGLGLGCNGVIRVLVEPLVANSKYVEALRLSAERPVAIATIYQHSAPGSIAAHVIVTEDSFSSSEGVGPAIEDLLATQLSRVISGEVPSGPAAFDVPGGSIAVFLEKIEPPVPLIIFGASHGAMPLLELADRLGWQTTIVDPQARPASVERFGLAHTVVLARSEEMPEHVEVTSRTLAVLMSHNYSHDVSLLRYLLSTPARYIGVMGPRKRTDRMLSEIRSQSATSSSEHLDMNRLHSPVGLDIGANGPNEVALSIMAEMRAVLAARSGGHLKECRTSIHGRVIDGEQVGLTETASEPLVA